jgi:pre-rRNA-processing protein TSR4
MQNFQAVIAAHPAQVLRYRIDEGAQPMWGRLAPIPVAVPPCDRCGAQRRFEFQILPQMLAFLGLEDSDADALDWCVVAEDSYAY